MEGDGQGVPTDQESNADEQLAFPSPMGISREATKGQLFIRIIKIILIETKFFTKQRLKSFI